MLAEFMVGGLPHPDRFTRIIGGAIRSSRSGRENMPVLAFGEMVDILWRDNNPEGAIRLEALWNELAKTCSFTLFRAYALDREEECEIREIDVLEVCSNALEVEIRRRQQVEQGLIRPLLVQRLPLPAATRPAQRDHRGFRPRRERDLSGLPALAQCGRTQLNSGRLRLLTERITLADEGVQS